MKSFILQKSVLIFKENKVMNNPLPVKAKLLILVLSMLIAPQISAQTSFSKDSTFEKTTPILQVENKKYRVNENIVITGERFEKFEQITVFIKEISNLQNQDNLIANWIVFADDNGKNTFSWRVPYESVFEVIAVGNKTGLEARTTISSLVPTPVVVSGNPDCSTLNSSTDPAFAHITSDYGFKLDTGTPNGTFPFTNGSFRQLTGGAPPEPNNSVTVSTISSELSSWSATRPITAVILKRGSDATVYPYNPASSGPDGPLPTNVPQGISHIEFCFQPTAKIIIVKHATPPSSFQFNFTASPGMTPANFSLTDNSVNTDPMQMFTVTDFNVKTITETNPAPYILQSINCTVDVGTGGTPAPVRTGNSINIDIKAGDQVTCTFNNDFVTASAVRISGQVFNPTGTGLSRAMVSMTDANGNVRTVMTNHFGYFSFDNVDSGNSYLFNVRHKSHIFAPQLIAVSNEINNMRFFPSQ